jgi:hypothetical protein
MHMLFRSTASSLTTLLPSTYLRQVRDAVDELWALGEEWDPHVVGQAAAAYVKAGRALNILARYVEGIEDFTNHRGAQ